MSNRPAGRSRRWLNNRPVLEIVKVQEIVIEIDIGIEIDAFSGVMVAFFDTDFEFSFNMNLRSCVNI